MSVAATEAVTPAAAVEADAPAAVVDPAAAPVVDPAAPEGEADPRVKRANSEAAKYRTDLRAAEAKLAEATAAQQTMLANIAKALGVPGATPETDPAQQVTELTGTVGSLTTEAAQLRAELLVHNLSGDLGANASALLDSRTFTTALHGLDPADAEYTTKVTAAIAAAVAGNKNLATGQAPSAGGVETAGQGAGSAAAVTADTFAAMSYADKAELFRTNPALYRQLAG